MNLSSSGRPVLGHAPASLAHALLSLAAALGALAAALGALAVALGALAVALVSRATSLVASVHEPDALELALADIAEPVRDHRVEPHRLSLVEDEGLGADHDLERALEYIAILVALMTDQVAAAGRCGAGGIGDLHEVDGVLGRGGETLPD